MSRWCVVVIRVDLDGTVHSSVHGTWDELDSAFEFADRLRGRGMKHDPLTIELDLTFQVCEVLPKTRQSVAEQHV